jgi:hypothetical protein
MITVRSAAQLGEGPAAPSVETLIATARYARTRSRRVGGFLFVGKPAEMRISIYAEGRFSRLAQLIDSETQGQCTCDITEPDG